MLEDILKETYGIIIYQEQVMEIAKVLSGFTLGDADLLRRAMGKKDQAEMNRQKGKFIDGAVERGVDADQASGIFDLVNEFAGYGFNKSHAAAYAMITFRTAYLKALHTTEFLAAIMSLDLANVEKLAQFYQEAKRMEVEVMPPCINRSQADFDVKDGAVLYALGALKNVGLEAMRHLVSVREEGGPFQSINDFARRVDMRQVNKRAIENLARSGAFDCVEPNRAMVLKNASLIQSIGTLAAKERESAQVSLFGDATVEVKDPDLEWADPWSQMDSLGHELGAIGFYLGGHPLDEHLDNPQLKNVMLAERLEEAGAGNYAVAGVVRKKQERVSKRGKRFAFVELSDPTGDYEILFSENVLSAHRDILIAGNVVMVKVKAERNEGETRLFADHASPLTGFDNKSAAQDAAPAAPAGLKIRLRQADIDTLDELQATLERLRSTPYQMSGYIELVLPLNDKREAAWRLDGRWAIDPSIRKAIKANSAVETISEIAA